MDPSLLAETLVSTDESGEGNEPEEKNDIASKRTEVIEKPKEEYTRRYVKPVSEPVSTAESASKCTCRHITSCTCI